MDIIYMYSPNHGSISFRSGLNIIHSDHAEATAFWSQFPSQIIYGSSPDAEAYLRVVNDGSVTTLRSKANAMPGDHSIYSYYNIVGRNCPDSPPPSLPPFSNDELRSRFLAAQETLRQSKLHLQTLRAQQAQWHHIDRQNALRNYQAAQRTVTQANQRVKSLSAMAAKLPDEQKLRQLEEHESILSAALPKIQKIETAAAQEANTVAQMRESIAAGESIGPSVAAIVAWIAAFLSSCFVVLCSFCIPQPLPRSLCGAIAAVSFVAGVIFSIAHRLKVKRVSKCREDALAAIDEKTIAARQLQAAAQNAAAAYREGLANLSQQLSCYTSVTMTQDGVRQALQTLHQQLSALQLSQQSIDEAKVQLQQAKDQLPSGPLPGSGKSIAPPELDRQTLAAQVSRTCAAMQAARLSLFELVFPVESGVPLILNDAFFDMDGQWLHAALDYLLALSEKRQLLFFTTQPVDRFFSTENKNVNFISVDWTE